MKTLINKQNPAIRITAPEIDVHEEEQMYIIPAEDYCIPMCIDDWTLVEEEFPKIISDEKMKQMGEQISKAAIANIKEQFSKVIEEYIENHNDGTYTFVNTEDEPKHTEVWVEGRTIFEQDEKPEAKLTGWVVRDRNGEIWVHDAYPKREYEIWVEGRYLPLNQNSFPDLKWEDEPVEVELTIRRK